MKGFQRVPLQDESILEVPTTVLTYIKRNTCPGFRDFEKEKINKRLVFTADIMSRIFDTEEIGYVEPSS